MTESIKDKKLTYFTRTESNIRIACFPYSSHQSSTELVVAITLLWFQKLLSVHKIHLKFLLTG